MISIFSNFYHSDAIDMANTDHCGTCIYEPRKKPDEVVEKTTTNLEPSAEYKPKN